MTRVLVDGLFDPLHSGHLEYFKQAKAMGGEGAMLLCRVAPEETKRPSFQSLEDRMRIIQSLRVIDAALTFPSLTHAVVFLNIDLLVKGKDWEGNLPDYLLKTCERYGCQVAYTDTVIQSSTDMLNAWVKRMNNEN